MLTTNSFDLGRGLLAQGRLGDAERSFQDSLHQTPEDRILQIWIAEICYERNQVSRAASLLAPAWEQGSQYGRPELVLAGSSLRARLIRAAGDLDGALAALEEGIQIIRWMDAPHYLAEIRSLFAWYQAECDHMEQALAWAQTVPLALEDQLPGISTGIQLLNLARVHLLARNAPEVLIFTGEFERLAQQAGKLRWQLEIALLRAAAFQQLDEPRQAQATLEQALALAQPERYLRLFVDEGPSIRTLLDVLIPILADPGLALYAVKIRGAFPAGG